MNNLKNIAETVINDASTGKVRYYFDGKEHPFVQLNASGAGNASASEIVLKGDIDKPVRELVGLFDASNGGASWSVDGSWTNTEPRYALDVSSLWNGAKELCKETVVSTGGFILEYSDFSNVIKEQTSTVFFPSAAEYVANSIIAGSVVDACDSMVHSRSIYGLYNDNYHVWLVYSSSGALSSGYMDNQNAAVPAFNLDLSKILMTRSADSDENVLYTDKFMSYEKYLATCTDNVKFLAMTDNVNLVVNVIKKPDEYIEIIYMTTADNTHAYLSAIITDKDDNILYYNVVKRIPLMYDDDNVIGDIVRISLPDNLPEGYKVGVFREVRNESYYTDTCSKIVWLDV